MRTRNFMRQMLLLAVFSALAQAQVGSEGANKVIVVGRSVRRPLCVGKK
jgi:hypothetical protein